MQKSFTIQLIPYAPILKNERIAYRIIKDHIVVGDNYNQPGWILYISCKTADTIAILKSVLELLKKRKFSFSIIKDQLTQYGLNAGACGNCEVGKVFTIYPDNESHAIELGSELCSLTQSFGGPVIPNALRLGTIIFAQYALIDHTEGLLFEPATKSAKHSPFFIPRRFKFIPKRKKLIGKYYVPVQLLASSPKGDIFKAINLRKWAFSWCLIKQGKPAALDDYFNREMKDRLLWQKEVLDSISDHIITPKVIEYFECDDSGYLVMEFVEGENFGKIIFDKLNGTTWQGLKNEIKTELLSWYLKAVDIILAIHKNGFVHRDITDSNFIVLPDGNLCVIDFELSFNIDHKVPNPPFVLGSYGYAAPEQLNYAIPDLKEDVYSMGALLCYILSGLQPIKFINDNRSVTAAKLYRLTGNAELTRLISRCIHQQRNERPELQDLVNGIEKYLNTIN